MGDVKRMELLKSIAEIRTPFLDTLIGLVTRLGEETIGIVILCVFFWCISKKVAYVIGVSFFLSSLSVQGMKILFRIPRPWVLDPAFVPVSGAIEHATGYSFPSGHTQNATALYGSLGAMAPQKPFKIILFTIPFLVAFSRLYLGVHTLLDVVVSLAITFLLIFIAVKIFSTDSIHIKREAVVASVIIIFAVVVIVIAAVLYANGTIEEGYIADCLKATGAGIGFAVGMFVERVYIGFSVKAKGIIWQIIKFIIGIAVVLALQEGLKYVIGTSLIANMVRYFLMITWITLFFPLVINRFFAVKEKG